MGRKNRKKNTTLTTKGSDDAPKARRSSKGGDPESKTASARTPKFKGVTSGMRVMQYQDHTLEINHKGGQKLTDIQLADTWATEFPQSDCMQRRDVKIVASVRRLYNRGRHTAAQGGIPPSRQSVPYDNDGQPIVKKSKKDSAKAA